MPGMGTGADEIRTTRISIVVSKGRGRKNAEEGYMEVQKNGSPCN